MIVMVRYKKIGDCNCPSNLGILAGAGGPVGYCKANSVPVVHFLDTHTHTHTHRPTEIERGMI